MNEDLSPWLNQEIEEIEESKHKNLQKTKNIVSQSSMNRTHKPYEFMYFKEYPKSMTKQDFHRPFIEQLKINRKELKFHIRFAQEKTHIPTRASLASKYYSRKEQQCKSILKSNSTPYFITKIDEFIKRNIIETKNYERPIRTITYIRKNTQDEITKNIQRQSSVRIKKMHNQHFLDRILTKLS